MPDSIPSGETAPAPPAWFCLRAAPKKEHLAAANVASALGVETFAPRFRYPKMTRRGKVTFIEAIFPGYFFAHCDETTLRAKVANTRGVTGIVHFGKSIPALPDSVIQSIRAWLRDSCPPGTAPANEVYDLAIALSEGQTVEIVNGPLQGQTGQIVRLKSSLERVELLMEILGQPQLVSISLSQLLLSPEKPEFAL